MKRFPLEARKAFLNLPQESSHIATNAPRWAEVFTPNDHQGALDPNRSVVVGDRGTGKSFWSSVLINQDIRNLVAKQYPRLRLGQIEGKLAFSDGGMAAQHPVSTEIATIAGRKFAAEDLWRAVLLKLSPFPPIDIPPNSAGWQPVVEWVASDPSRRNAQFRALDLALTEAGRTYVLVFDALDVIADQWMAIRFQLEGLIKLALAVRALRSVRIKLFIRPDMADDRRLWEVGDASKLRHSEVRLAWKRRDLYGLLWTLLANTPDDDQSQGGEAFREHCAKAFDATFEYQDDSWRPPRRLVEDEDRQQEVFHALAGEYMGAGPTKGDTYKWVTNHLADAAGFAAPRSFLLAMKEGADKTKSRETVLDKSGIESGARDASKVRVQELSEDYRWMGTVLKAMDGLVVPLTKQNLVSRWQQRRTLTALKGLIHTEDRDRRFIPPGDVLDTEDENEAYSKLIDQLMRLNIFLELSDGRINMPDLFRLQANVKKLRLPPRQDC
jgi:hypothetical protein